VLKKFWWGNTNQRYHFEILRLDGREYEVDFKGIKWLKIGASNGVL
jgi:hypothetical protein